MPPDRSVTPAGRLLFAGILLLGCWLAPAPRFVAGVAAQPAPTGPASIADLKARALFVRGMTQAYLDDYEEAISLYERALEAAPAQAAILSALADAEAQRENLSTALYYAREARDQAPSTAHYHLELARLLRADGQPRPAVEAYRALLRRFPDHTQGRLALARLFSEQDRPRRALPHYETLLESSASLPLSAYTDMLELYGRTEDEDGRERVLRRLLERRPETPRFRRQLGRLYTRQGRYEDAISVLEPLLQQTPRDPRLLSRLQMLYTETNQPQKAERLGSAVARSSASPDQLVDRARMLYDRRPADSTSAPRVAKLLRRALERAPDHAEALDLLGTLYADQGRSAEAAEMLRRAVDANPRNPARWRRAAAAHLEAGAPEEAAALADDGLLLFPGRADLLRLQGRAQLDLGAPATARSRFRDALAEVDTTGESASTRAALHVGLGRSWRLEGRPDRADAAFRTALRLAPTHVPALTHSARLLADRERDHDRALRLARRALEQTSSPTSLGTLGYVQFVRGEHTTATRTFEEAVSAGPAPAWVYERFGDLQRALGNDARARQYWNEALDRGGASAALKRKLQSLPRS